PAVKYYLWMGNQIYGIGNNLWVMIPDRWCRQRVGDGNSAYICRPFPGTLPFSFVSAPQPGGLHLCAKEALLSTAALNGVEHAFLAHLVKFGSAYGDISHGLLDGHQLVFIISPLAGFGRRGW